MSFRVWSVVCSAALFLTIGSVPSFGQQQSPAQGKDQKSDQKAPPADPIKGDITANAPVDPKTYKIGPEDVLSIRVWREPELSGNVAVRPDGKITLTLAGEVQAAGLTPEQLTVIVAEAFGKIMNKPEVIVAVVSVQSKRYYVSGEVDHSGPVPLVTPTTILQALSSAGLREWAKRGKIVIMRGTDRLKFNYNQVIKGKNLEQNVTLQDGDHIFVP